MVGSTLAQSVSLLVDSDCQWTSLHAQLVIHVHFEETHVLLDTHSSVRRVSSVNFALHMIEFMALAHFRLLVRSYN
jgi:hypothetical protein